MCHTYVTELRDKMSKKYIEFEGFIPEDPLARVKGESARASQALLDYALMGGRRSLRQLITRYQAAREAYTKDPINNSLPPTVRYTTLAQWSARNHWQERVKIYDEHVRLREQEKFEDERKRWREMRLKAAQGLLSKAAKALNEYKPSRASLSEITRALQVAHDELRIEFGEEDQIKTPEVVITVRREDKQPDATDD